MSKRLLILPLLLAVLLVLGACNGSEPILHGVRAVAKLPDGVSGLSMSEFTSLVPDEWLALRKNFARYELRFAVVVGRTKECGPYGVTPGSTLYMKAAGIRLVVRDATDDSLVVASETYQGSLPNSCPRTHEFKAHDFGGTAMTMNDTEWFTPDPAELEEWILENLEGLPDLVKE